MCSVAECPEWGDNVSAAFGPEGSSSKQLSDIPDGLESEREGCAVLDAPPRTRLTAGFAASAARGSSAFVPVVVSKTNRPRSFVAVAARD